MGFRLLLLLGLAATLSAWGTEHYHWQSDAEKSELAFSVEFEGLPVSGVFHNFTVHAQSDQQGNPLWLQVSIDTGSADMYNGDINSEIKKPDWFAVTSHPEALFSSQQITANGDGFIAEGTLQLKGAERPVSVPLTWQTDSTGQQPTLTGEIVLMRNHFNIGGGEWAEDGPISHAVTVKFSVKMVAAQ